MTGRNIMRIELTAAAKQKLETLCDRHGMTQVAMMSRIVEWFASKDAKIQGAVLGHFIEGMKDDTVKLILKQMIDS